MRLQELDEDSGQELKEIAHDVALALSKLTGAIQNDIIIVAEVRDAWDLLDTAAKRLDALQGLA
jgi:long-subunit acyl-CoA synthetase (AMP-forming)